MKLLQLQAQEIVNFLPDVPESFDHSPTLFAMRAECNENREYLSEVLKASLNLVQELNKSKRTPLVAEDLAIPIAKVTISDLFDEGRLPQNEFIETASHVGELWKYWEFDIHKNFAQGTEDLQRNCDHAAGCNEIRLELACQEHLAATARVRAFRAVLRNVRNCCKLAGRPEIYQDLSQKSEF